MPDPTKDNQTITEYVDSRGQPLRIEPRTGVLRGVKLLGDRSRNGRSYPEETLRRAMPLYEGAKVNVNHPKGDPLSPRDYQDRIGVIRDVELRPAEGLFGVLHFNPHHPLAEQLVWDANNAPENVGLSHNVLARTARRGGEVVVEQITKVQSVDLVADPATTRGLFEQQSGVAPAAGLDAMTLQQLRERRPDLLREATAPLETELAHWRAEADRFAAREAADERRRRVEEVLVEHGLPLPVDGDPLSERLVSPAFLGQLFGAADDASLRQLVKDRADALAEASRWRSSVSPALCREQSPASGGGERRPAGAREFVAAITGR